MTPAFTGADIEAAKAYAATVDAVVRLRASAEELVARLETCAGFAVGQAYAAFISSFAGSAAEAARRAGLARHARRGTRRERQLVEILLLSVDGDRRRAAALAAEHVDEFADDAVALTIIDRWSVDRAQGHPLLTEH